MRNCGVTSYLLPASEIVGREGARLQKPREVALIHHLAAFASRTGTEVDDVVSGAHHLLVMLDDDHGVPAVSQTLERIDETLVVARMESDRRLIEDIEDASKPLSDLRRETDALRLAAGEGRRRAIEREVVEANVEQELQPFDDFREDILEPL